MCDLITRAALSLRMRACDLSDHQGCTESVRMMACVICAITRAAGGPARPQHSEQLQFLPWRYLVLIFSSLLFLLSLIHLPEWF